MAVEVMEQINDPDANETRDTLFLVGGVAMVIFGAGLILATPVVRRHLGGLGIGGLLSAALPDFQRLLRLRSM